MILNAVYTGGGIVLVIGAAIGVVGYLYGSFRQNASSASAQSNTILRGLIEDQKLEIQKLRDELGTIKVKLAEIEQRRDFLERLVMSSLSDYFKSNPEVAKHVHKSYKKDGKE